MLDDVMNESGTRVVLSDFSLIVLRFLTSTDQKGAYTKIVTTMKL